MSASLCHCLLNPELDHAAAYRVARSHLNSVLTQALERAEKWVEQCRPLDAGAFVDALVQLAVQVASMHADQALTDAQAAYVLTRFSPQRLLAGSALQGLARADNNHEPLACVAHRIHAIVLGAGRHEQHVAVRYRRCLERHGISLPATRSARLAGAFAWQAEDWNLSALRLSLGCAPLEYEAQAIGAALFEAGVGLPALVVTALRSRDPQAAVAEAQSDAALRTAAIDAVAEWLAQQQGDWDALARAIASGFFASASAFDAWQAGVVAELSTDRLSAAHAMLELVARKGRHAAGYHGRLKLGGEPFDDLLVKDPAAFVTALAASRWVKPGQPDQSLLLTRLVRFGGPMFRVFSDEELEVMRAWVTSLASGAPAVPQTTDLVTGQVHQRAANDDVAPVGVKARRLHIRDRYMRLLNIERHPEARLEAREFAQDWLERHARAARGADVAPFETYTHERLRAWFDERSSLQARSYDAAAASVDKTREEVIDEALQLAPMILVDGGWIQRWSYAGLCDTPIGALLFKIFSDEIGNGRPDWNHPNIYRRLLAQMELELPDFRSREFAWDRRFDDASFEVPVFWLSVSQYPLSFLPETLGLNLAMELSGVGGSYRTARDELRHHGFDTLFVDLHNTIDNVSSGHSAMALEAIQIHMDEALCTGSPAQVAAQWKRVWAGFLALSPPARRWRDAWPRLRLA